MARKARSALGEIIDFDRIAIKQQLASTPVPVSVNQRRRFIDEKDGIKTKEVINLTPAPSEDSPLAVAAEAARESASAKKSKK